MFGRCVAVCLLLLTADLSADAQAESGVDDHGWLTGVLVGLPGYKSEVVPQLFTIGAQFTRVRKGYPGADIAIGMMPYAVSAGVIALGMRVGVAVPLAPAPRLLVLPSAGASLVAAGGPGGGAGIAGANIGLATVLLATRSFGLRTGVTFHGFPDVRGTYWLAEVGFVTLSKP
jgi:hypothetical protein